MQLDNPVVQITDPIRLDPIDRMICCTTVTHNAIILCAYNCASMHNCIKRDIILCACMRGKIFDTTCILTNILPRIHRSNHGMIDLCICIVAYARQTKHICMLKHAAYMYCTQLATCSCCTTLSMHMNHDSALVAWTSSSWPSNRSLQPIRIFHKKLLPLGPITEFRQIAPQRK